jgi:hypothetical protein
MTCGNVVANISAVGAKNALHYVAKGIMWQHDQKGSVSELFWTSWAT